MSFNMEQALQAAVFRAAASGLGEISRQFDPDQSAVSMSELRETQRTFSRAALLHCQTISLFIESLKQLPQLYDAFAEILAARGVSVTEFEQAARDGITRFQPKG